MYSRPLLPTSHETVTFSFYRYVEASWGRFFGQAVSNRIG